MSVDPREQCSDECREALRRLGAFLDGELGEVTQARMAAHLDACVPCTGRVDFEEQLRALVRAGCAGQAPAELRERILLQLDELAAG